MHTSAAGASFPGKALRADRSPPNTSLAQQRSRHHNFETEHPFAPLFAEPGWHALLEKSGVDHPRAGQKVETFSAARSPAWVRSA